MAYPLNLDHVFKSGIHIGETLHHVIETDVSYIERCMDNIDDFELDNDAYDYYEQNLITLDDGESNFNR